MMDEPAGTLTDSPFSSSADDTPREWAAIERTAPDDRIPFSVTMLGPCNATGSGEENHTFTCVCDVYFGVW